MLRYNVDGRIRLTGNAIIPPLDDRGRSPVPSDDLTPAERAELLTHCCFVRTTKPSDDHRHFYDTCAEPAPGPA